MIVLPTRNSHFYLRNPEGIITPFYEVPNASKPGEMRRTTIKDARKVNALPSVTNILGVLDKPALNDWRVRTAIEAALTLPRLPDESVDDYASRVVDDAEQQSVDARDFGTRIHDAVDKFLTQPQKDVGVPIDVSPFVKPTFDWLNENVIKVHATEFYCAHDRLKYAGRVDLKCDLKHIGTCIVDFKTQRVRNGKPTFYDEWSLQLIGYAQAVAVPGETLRRLSLIIDSSAPGPCYTLQWTNDLDWEMFQHCYHLWCWLKGYKP